MFAGVAWAASSRRRGGKSELALLTFLVALSNVVALNEYLARLVRNGPSVTWTDAIYPLSDCLARVKASVVYIDDWGMFDNLRMMNRGRLPLRDGSDPLSKADFSDDDRRAVLERIAIPNAVFVGHTEGNEFFTTVNPRLRSISEQAGYRREIFAELADRNGRPIFEVVRFVR